MVIHQFIFEIFQFAPEPWTDWHWHGQTSTCSLPLTPRWVSATSSWQYSLITTVAPLRVQTGHLQEAIILFLNSDPRQPFRWGQIVKADNITSRPASQTLTYRLLKVRGRFQRLFMAFTAQSSITHLEGINMRIKHKRINNIDGHTAGVIQFIHCTKTTREAHLHVCGLLTQAWELCTKTAKIAQCDVSVCARVSTCVCAWACVCLAVCLCALWCN